MRARTVTDLGAIIRRSRRERRMTQASLATAAGVSRSTLIAIERGKGTVELALALRVLGALDLVADIVPMTLATGAIDLDELYGDG